MGDYPQKLIPDLGLKDMVLKEKGTSETSDGFIWRQALAVQIMRRRLLERQRRKISRRPKIMMKRNANLEGSRRPLNGLERRVKDLQRLVPSVEHVDLDSLFGETADYIVGLQMTVKVMQIMIRFFSSSYNIKNGKEE